MADETQILVQSLVERAQSGDGGAFGELYEQFAPGRAALWSRIGRS